MPVPLRYMESSRRPPRRRRRGRAPRPRGPRRRLPILPFVILAVVVAGGITAAVLILTHQSRVRAERSVVDRFARAWERRDYRTMYGQLDTATRRRVPEPAFARAYRRAAATATVATLRTGKANRHGGNWSLPVSLRTQAFGTLRGRVTLPLHGDPPRVAWTPPLTFPGLRRGERLRRIVQAPRRAPLVARDGQPLADRDGFPSALGAPLGSVGTLGRPGGAAPGALTAAGFPADTLVGTSGLERTLDAQLRGRAGGRLLAGRRVLARARAVP